LLPRPFVLPVNPISRNVLGSGSAFSLWLDIIRLGAALAVFLEHAFAITRNGLPRLDGLGSIAVAAFFVLSGFVIAYTVDQKEHSIRLYTAARLARLWSILIPALLLTLIFDKIGIYFDRQAYVGWEPWIEPFASPLSLIPAALFLNEIWFLSITPLSNGVVWSFGYEAWYYAAFGAFKFLRGKWHWIVPIALMACAGPKILLLSPAWLMGAVAYHISKRISCSEFIGWLLVISPVPIIAMWGSSRAWKLLPPTNELFHAAFYAHYFVFGAALSLHFVGAFVVQDRFKPLLIVCRPIRACASLTLSVYLLHLPLLLMFSAILSNYHPGTARAASTVSLTLLTVVILGMMLEPQRHRIRRFLSGELLWSSMRPALQLLRRSMSCYF
jgi:peptidoglycan/LPS O-acetylase OafA/YrhL